MMKRLLIGLLCLLLAAAPAMADRAADAAQDITARVPPSSSQGTAASGGAAVVTSSAYGTAPGEEPVIPEEGQWPRLNVLGYLDEGEFVWEDPTNGVWRYCSSTLKVQIIRRATSSPKKLWFEAEVWSLDGGFDLCHAVEGKYVSAVDIQPSIASRNGCVLAINADQACIRWSYKSERVGVAIRDGQILWSRTGKDVTNSFPPLNNLVLYEDGNMEVYGTRERTAQEFIEMGAKHVLSFGPVLIRNGVIDKERIARCDRFPKSARTVIGMVEKGHYWVMMAEGETKGGNGSSILGMAELLLEKGCTVGFNLDGGRTSSIMFMGKQLCEVWGAPVQKKYARRTSELLYIGTSALVEGYQGTTY